MLVDFLLLSVVEFKFTRYYFAIRVIAVVERKSLQSFLYLKGLQFRWGESHPIKRSRYRGTKCSFEKLLCSTSCDERFDEITSMENFRQLHSSEFGSSRCRLEWNERRYGRTFFYTRKSHHRYYFLHRLQRRTRFLIH